MRKFERRLVGVFWLMFIGAGGAPMFAQSDSARLQGIITDQSGALVPGAKVQVTDISTNRVLKTTTAPDTGSVVIPSSAARQLRSGGFEERLQTHQAECHAASSPGGEC